MHQASQQTFVPLLVYVQSPLPCCACILCCRPPPCQILPLYLIHCPSTLTALIVRPERARQSRMVEVDGFHVLKVNNYEMRQGGISAWEEVASEYR